MTNRLHFRIHAIPVSARGQLSNRSPWLRITLAALIMSLAGNSHALGSRTQNIPFERTGTVIDWNTKQPLAGAYVFASYREKFELKSWCIRTRGMYTGSDGRFHFPVEKLDGVSPVWVGAIKPDFATFISGEEMPEARIWKKQEAAAYANRKIYLVKQDARNPDLNLGSGDEFCHRARTSEAARAGAQFLKLEKQEYIKYGSPRQQIDALQEMIDQLESIDSVAPPPDKKR